MSTVTLDRSYWRIVPDIKDISGKYMFSDGIGLMRYELAVEIARKLKIKPGKPVPSAFQIRFGGAKGMLTVWDEAFPRGTSASVRVHIRQSMNKFNCDHSEMEVVGYSKRIPLFLNRQIIAVLSAHGVQDLSFEAIQREALDQLNRAMTAEGATDALYLMLNHSRNDLSHEVATAGTGANMAAFFDAGLNTLSCEHLYNMMGAYRRRILKDMLMKSRIPVDPSKGFCAIGVLDEIGVLGAREIFCQYTDPHTGEIKPVLGHVTVGRSPCLHPGDVQPVEAVDCPELMHLVDVIVFPRQGYRPLPSMLSGGDLDGDIFFVIFDPRIALMQRHLISPMDYTAPTPITLDHNVTWHDVADFFVEFINNDCIGLVANAHVVHADKQKDGVFSPQCLQLAELHSAAVDFPKTGISVAGSVRELKLLPKHAPGSYPDFMSKHHKVSYSSKRILGKLYRSCLKNTEIGIPRNQSNVYADPTSYSRFIENEHSLKVHEIFESIESPNWLMDDAVEVCHAYNSELHMLMIRYGVVDEGEIVSGNAVRFENGLLNIRDAERHNTIQMRVNREVRSLRLKYRSEFFSDIDERDKEQEIIKASAWYKACRQVNASCDNTKTILHSFPWVVSDILLSIIRSQLKRK